MSESLNSKAGKKNLKRAEKRAQQRAQKLKEDGVIDRLKHENVDPMENLKTQLQEAKDNKDHKLAAKLRKDIWVMQDKLAGQIPDKKELKEKISAEQKQIRWSGKYRPGERDEVLDQMPDENLVDQKDLTTDTNHEDSQALTEKKLRNLRKKLQQIEKLKTKQDEGEELEELQIAKIQTEDAVLQEIDELQQLMDQPQA